MLKRAGIQTVKQCRHGKTKPRLQHKTGLNGQNGSGTYQSMAVECGQGTPRIGSIQCHWGGLVRFTVVGPVTSSIRNFNIFYEGRVTGCDVDLVGGEGRGGGGGERKCRPRVSRRRSQPRQTPVAPVSAFRLAIRSPTLTHLGELLLAAVPHHARLGQRKPREHVLQHSKEIGCPCLHFETAPADVSARRRARAREYGPIAASL